MPLASALLAFLVAAWFARRLSHPSSPLYILDHPNARSLHTRPTPRTGGLAIVCATLLGAALLLVQAPASPVLPWIVAAGLLVAGVSFLDDRRGVPVRIRLPVHVLAAALVLLSGVGLSTLELPGFVWYWPPVVGLAVSLVFLVWMINLYNFMDGMDGLAGGMAVIGFGALAGFGWLAGDLPFAALNLAVAAAAAGFLVSNFPPARIFMGDVGSATLGLLAAAFSLWGASAGILPFWAALLLFSPFIVDATGTLIRRLLAGERVWEAHRTHGYQCLAQRFGQRRTVLGEYVLMLACAASALWAAGQGAAWQSVILSGWGLFYMGAFFWVARLGNGRTAE